MRLLSFLFCATVVKMSFAQNWTQIGADIDGKAASDLSGYSVSLSSDGETVAIGHMVMTELALMQATCACTGKKGVTSDGSDRLTD